ncbi:MAG: UDP-glucose 4-epimerase GalE [Actinomycetota bacterium]
MKVLLTGGAGYIGSVTAQALLDANHQVVVVDDLSTGHRQMVPDGVELIEGAVGDPATVAKALAWGVDACIHFAARIEAGESMQRPEDFFANNTAQTLMLLQTLIHAGVSRFVFSSTAAVYGDPVGVPIAEEDPTIPTNAYGETKLLVERALQWIGARRGLRYACLRYFNASGATDERGEMHEPESHLIPLVLRVALGSTNEAIVFGDDYDTPDGTCIRDYVHVLDLADAHVRALSALDVHESITCNLGHGTGFSVKEVIEACRRVTGHAIPVRIAPRRPGDPARLIASSAKARELLGWIPQHSSIDNIVSTSWKWHSRSQALR